MRIASCLLALSFMAAARTASAGFEGDFEAGVVIPSRNDTRIPGDKGTRISLVDDLSSAPAPAFRLRLGYRVGDRHLLTALYAPLQVNARGRLDRDVHFAGGYYPAGSPLLAVYRFNSYRLTYRYSLFQNEALDLALGFTAKVRDAETSLYGADSRRKTNVGFVPLLNVHAAWRPSDSSIGMLLDADAMAAPQGRAEDLLLAATWKMSEDVELRAGYRMVEGGADNDKVFSFAWLHYFVVGLTVRI